MKTGILRSRVIILFSILIAGWAGVFARLLYIQVLPNPRLEKLENNLYQTVVKIPPQRGKILDRSGTELASSVSSQSLFADPKLIENPEATAAMLSPLIRISKKNLSTKLKQRRRFVWLKRHVAPDAAIEINSWKLKGLGFIEEGKRVYPNGDLARPLIGFVGRDGAGLEGLEKFYDDELKGELTSIQSRRDARGTPLVVNGQVFQTNQDGASLRLTLDRDLQYELEKALADIVRRKQALRATGVILEPTTSEILAMGIADSKETSKKNRLVTDVFEPGSTFKIVMAAAALRSGKIHPNTKFNCENGKFRIGKRTIHEADTKHSFEWLTLAEILEKSSNIGSAKVAFAVGQPLFKQTILDFGFMSRTGVDFPGEIAGLWSQAPWSDHLFASMSFGHGIGVSALQMANAYAAIANQGQLMQPYLVKEIRDSNDEVIQEKSPTLIRQVLDPKQARLMTLMLTGTTEEGGTGGLARVDGYPVAGKTGTAQKVDLEKGGYKKGAYISSFAGFVPSNNPQFVIYILVDEPKKGYYGSEVAAPVFHRVASYALRKKGFMPIVVKPDVMTKKSQEEKVPVTEAPTMENLDETFPNFKGLTLREVAARLNSMNVRDSKLVGSGVAVWQDPKPGVMWNESRKVKIIFREKE